MNVTEVRSEEELKQLRPAWDGLLAQSPSATTFLTWDWISTWWSAYGTPGELHILLFADESGAPRGIAPLRRERVRRYGRALEALSFVGYAPAECDSDYLDFIVARGWEKQVAEAFFSYLAGAQGGGAVLLLNEIPEASPNLPVLQAAAERRGMAWQVSDVPCAVVHLPEEWSDYLAMLAPRFRTKVRSVLRNLEGRSDVQFRFCDDPGQLERLLPALFDLHTRRWAQEGQPGVFGSDRKRLFYDRISRLLLREGSLRLSWLEWRGRIVACQYGFNSGHTYLQLQEGYEPAAEHWNPGIALRAWSIRELLKEGVRDYDFLGGTARHKMNWGAEAKHSKRVLVAGKTLGNLLFRRGPAWERKARDLAAKAVPEKILALRRGARQRQVSSNGASGGVRHAAAVCYFRSGLPELTRRLRDRYEISVAANGPWPRISWRRRRQPSGRILYYHRVTGGDDPFFDGIAAEAFERQMCYLARHHRVVPLDALMRHLEEGEGPEPVIAITFDDGYRDNYEKAFPILRRYRLPATIFLTTGSLDSREPLWFEQVADAVKRSTRDFIDVEMDLPRRFWLRNEAERLAANRRIFELLREMCDAERRACLPALLRELCAPAEENRCGAMLTWDQVREMKACGIDFGGHTVTHPFLSKLSAAEVAREVTECKRRIEQELQHGVEYFAYPNGRPEDFVPSNKEMLRAAGYCAAVTTMWGVNYSSTDRMELRRGGPWETELPQFALKLDWYQWVNQ